MELVSRFVDSAPDRSAKSAINFHGFLMSLPDGSLKQAGEMTSGTKFLCFLTALLCVPFLSGCAAAVIAAPAVMLGAQVASGSSETVIQATVDESSFSADARSILASAKTIAVVGGDRTSVAAADLFETLGGYKLTIDRETAKTGEMTGSERRQALRSMCAKTRPDIAAIARMTKSESGNAFLGILTMRASVNSLWVMEMLDCRTSTTYSFGGGLSLDGGMANLKSGAEIEDLAGTAIATKILDAIGKGKTLQTGAPQLKQAVAQPTRTEIAPIPVSTTSATSTRPSVSDMNSRTMTTAEVQKRLLELGYQPGKADGLMGQRTVDAIKKFQQDRNLTVSGQADSETVAKLRN